MNQPVSGFRAIVFGQVVVIDFPAGIAHEHIVVAAIQLQAHRELAALRRAHIIVEHVLILHPDIGVEPQNHIGVGDVVGQKRPCGHRFKPLGHALPLRHIHIPAGIHQPMPRLLQLKPLRCGKAHVKNL